MPAKGSKKIELFLNKKEVKFLLHLLYIDKDVFKLCWCKNFRRQYNLLCKLRGAVKNAKKYNA